MKTEEEIVYSILETLTASHVGSDLRINERLIRSFIREYRADSIRKNYRNGHSISEFMLQEKSIKIRGPVTQGQEVNLFGRNDIANEDYKEFSFKIPKMISLEYNYGLSVLINNYELPIYSNSKFQSYKRDSFNKLQVMVGVIGYDSLRIYIPVRTTIGQIIDNFILSTLSTSKSFPITIRGLFADPSDADGYDWTKSIFPFPEERLGELTSSIIARKAELLLTAKPDEVVNARKDEILYHENHNISNG